MSEAKPKRKFWQFHLSTAVMMMVAVGGFIWINVNPNHPPIPECKPEARVKDSIEEVKYEIELLRFKLENKTSYGWPVTAFEMMQVPRPKPAGFNSALIKWFGMMPVQTWSPGGVVMDAAIAFLGILLVAWACEWWIFSKQLIRDRAT